MPSQIESLAGLPTYTECQNFWRERAFATNKAVFAPYKDIFMGREVVILGSGPTGQFFNPIRDAIYIGVNSTILASPQLIDYYFSCDYSYNVEVANESPKEMKRFYGRNSNWNVGFINDEVAARGNASIFYLRNNFRYHDKYKFTEDLASNLLDIPTSIIFASMLFALYGHPKTIYLVGCDCGASRSDAFGKASIHSPNTRYETMVEGWKAIKYFADRYYPDIRIVSINPRRLTHVFYDMYQNPCAVNALNYKDKGEYAKALKLAKKAYEKDPDNPGIISLYSDILCKNELVDDAIYLLEAAAKKSLLNSAACETLTNLYDKGGDMENTIRCLSEAMQRDPNNIEIKATFAMFLYNRGFINEARKIFEAGSMAFRMLFVYRIYKPAESNPNRGECIRIMRDAMAWDDGWLSLINAICMHLRPIGEHGSMEALVRETMERNSEFDAPGYRFLAWSARDKGHGKEAMHYARELWKIDPVSVGTPQLVLQLLIWQGKYREALALLDEIESVTPGLDYPPYYFSLVYEALGEMDKALQYAEKAVTLYPVMLELYRLPYIDRYMTLLRKTGQYEKAEEYINGLIEENVLNSELQRQKATLLDSLGEGQEAIAAARQALSADPANTSLCIFLVNLIQKHGNIEEAQEILDARLQFTPAWSAGWRKKAELYSARQDRGFDSEMLACALKALETDPESIPMLDFYTSTSKKLSAIDTLEEWEKGIARNPGWGNGWVQISEYYASLGEMDSALFYAHEAVENAPDYQWSWVCLIDKLLGTEDTELAEEVTREFMGMFPENGLPLRQMARICQAKGNNGQALIWMRKACHKSPQEVTALWKVYVSMLHSKKMYQEEKTALRQALRVNPFWLAGWDTLINLSAPAQDKIYFLRQATTYNPAWADGWKRLADLTGVPEEKAEYLGKAARMAPSRIDFWDSLLAVVSDEEELRRIYKEALEHHPNWSEGYYRLSLLYS